jgi:hypothetical protein
MKEFSFEHIQSMASATSSGLASRLSGMAAASLSGSSSPFSFDQLSSIGVVLNDGQMALIRMPLRPNSRAADFVRPTTACFVAPYTERKAAPINPAADAVFSITPPPRPRHRSDLVLHAEEDSFEVHGDHAIEILLRNIGQPLHRMTDASVIYRYIQFPEVSERLGDGRFYIAFFRHISCDAQGRSSIATQLASCLLQSLFLDIE